MTPPAKPARWTRLGVLRPALLGLGGIGVLALVTWPERHTSSGWIPDPDYDSDEPDPSVEKPADSTAEEPFRILCGVPLDLPTTLDGWLTLQARIAGTSKDRLFVRREAPPREMLLAVYVRDSSLGVLFGD